jgi:hypothetical protein
VLRKFELECLVKVEGEETGLPLTVADVCCPPPTAALTMQVACAAYEGLGLCMGWWPEHIRTPFSKSCSPTSSFVKVDR